MQNHTPWLRALRRYLDMTTQLSAKPLPVGGATVLSCRHVLDSGWRPRQVCVLLIKLVLPYWGRFSKWEVVTDIAAAPRRERFASVLSQGCRALDLCPFRPSKDRVRRDRGAAGSRNGDCISTALTNQCTAVKKSIRQSYKKGVTDVLFCADGDRCPERFLSWRCVADSRG
jgi:hypothetical protein